MSETHNRREDQPTVIGTRWPLVYLMPEGPALMSLEWEIGGWDVTLSTTDGKTGEAHGLHKETGEDWGREMNLHDPEAWRWLETRLREAEGRAPEPFTGGMTDLQRRRIEAALADANAIEGQMDDIDESLESIRLKVDELVCSLHSIRLGMIREADEATAKEGTES